MSKRQKQEEELPTEAEELKSKKMKKGEEEEQEMATEEELEPKKTPEDADQPEKAPEDADQPKKASESAEKPKKASESEEEKPGKAPKGEEEEPKKAPQDAHEQPKKTPEGGEPVPQTSKQSEQKSEKDADGPALYQDPPEKLTSSSGKKYTLKITSWNVDGLRAWFRKKGLEWVSREDPDILCLQETKCTENQLPVEMKDLAKYPHKFWASSNEKEGYSGVALLSKNKPLKVTYGIGEKQHDQEGRTITAEFSSYFLVTVYVPNAGRGLVRLEYRQQWDKTFRSYLEGLAAVKPIILCGDLNVAHQEIDLKNPKGNKKNAGFTPEERAGFTQLLESGFVDTFRYRYPETPNAFTFWTYIMNARAKNVGWRLDYFLVSKELLEGLCDSKIRSSALGSDHCPITLYMAM